MGLLSIKAEHMCIHPASRAFLSLPLGFSIQSTLSRTDTGSRGDVFVVRTSNQSKTSEKMGYFDCAKVSLHIL